MPVLQKFTNFQEALLAARVLSFVLNESTKLYANGNKWIVDSEVGFYVALFIYIDICKYKYDPRTEETSSTDERVFWDAEAISAWERWRKANAGTEGYHTVNTAAVELRKSPLMKNSIGYLSPEKLAEWSYEDALQEESNAARSQDNGTHGYWNGYDWIYTKEEGDGEDRSFGL
jgi:hypothetical protein